MRSITVQLLCRYDTIGKMLRRAALGLMLGMACSTGASAQAPETYSIYTEAPRLFLRPARLRLLRRERERKSLRWDQLALLMAGGAPMPEPGFANALYYQISGDAAFAARAIAWAAHGTGARQLALVFDWCQDRMSPAERQALLRRLRQSIEAPPGPSFSDLRDQALAAIAISADAPAASQAALRRIVETRWGAAVAELKSGKPALTRQDAQPLWELFHAIRDNLNTDLRESFPAFFKEFPIYHLMSHYPAPFPAAENDYRIGASPGGEPDLQAAVLSRAAELSMVALDSNSPETQVLQGWLMNDRFLMRGSMGITYELLWANPYQPGLSYYHVPLVFYEQRLGQLFIRSSWEDDATWVGLFAGHLQMFRKGAVSALDPASVREPLDLEEAVVMGPATRQFKTPARAINDVFIVGLQPNTSFHLEIEDEEMTEVTSGPAGIVFLKGLRSGVLVRLTPRKS